jgi:hypothetical protein
VPRAGAERSVRYACRVSGTVAFAIILHPIRMVRLTRCGRDASLKAGEMAMPAPVESGVPLQREGWHRRRTTWRPSPLPIRRVPLVEPVFRRWARLDRCASAYLALPHCRRAWNQGTVHRVAIACRSLLLRRNELQQPLELLLKLTPGRWGSGELAHPEAEPYQAAPHLVDADSSLWFGSPRSPVRKTGAAAARGKARSCPIETATDWTASSIEWPMLFRRGQGGSCAGYGSRRRAS